MSEEQLINETLEERSHRHHHHHSGSSRSGKHRHSHRHSHHHHRSHRHHSGSFSFKNLAYKLTPKSFSSTNHLRKIATSTSSAKNNSFTVTLGRILFILIILGVVCFSAGYIFFEEESAIFRAKDTPSENSQLKVQLVRLEMQLEDVEAELERYKQKYGELEDVEDSESDTENTQN